MDQHLEHAGAAADDWQARHAAWNNRINAARHSLGEQQSIAAIGREMAGKVSRWEEELADVRSQLAEAQPPEQVDEDRLTTLRAERDTLAADVNRALEVQSLQNMMESAGTRPASKVAALWAAAYEGAHQGFQRWAEQVMAPLAAEVSALCKAMDLPGDAVIGLDGGLRVGRLRLLAAFARHRRQRDQRVPGLLGDPGRLPCTPPGAAVAARLAGALPGGSTPARISSEHERSRNRSAALDRVRAGGRLREPVERTAAGPGSGAAPAVGGDSRLARGSGRGRPHRAPRRRRGAGCATAVGEWRPAAFCGGGSEPSPGLASRRASLVVAPALLHVGATARRTRARGRGMRRARSPARLLRLDSGRLERPRAGRRARAGLGRSRRLARGDLLGGRPHRSRRCAPLPCAGARPDRRL